jgi:hypothetical protein
MKMLTSRLETSQTEAITFKKQSNQIKKEANTLIQQLKQQLLGAVRRINYLIDEKKKI